MSVTNYLDYFNKGKRSVLSENAIELKSSRTSVPKFIQGVEQAEGSIKTMARGKLNLPIVDIASLKSTLLEYSGARGTGLNQTICVLGDPGMGKSAIVLETAKQICTAFNKMKNEQRKFVAFTTTNKELLKTIFKNPENYYIFIDVRMTAYEKYELKGTPFPSKEKELAETMVALYDDWMATLFLPNAAGMVFLDEINQADIGTQTALYGLLHKDERTIGGRSIANKDSWTVHCAGNLPEGMVGVKSLLAALQDRVGGSVWLEVTYPVWLEWASTATAVKPSGESRPTFHPLILGFLAQNYDVLEPEDFNKVFIQQDVKGGLNAPNPRNFVALSEALYSYDDILIQDAAELVDEIARMSEAYKAIPSGSYKKTNAYEAIEAKKKQYKKLETGYAMECGQRSAIKINHIWARKFQRFVASQNMSINDIFELDNEEKAKEAIVKKLSYSKTEQGVSTGSSPQQVTSNIAQLKDIIQSIMLQFIDNCGLGEYVKGNLMIPVKTKIGSSGPSKEYIAFRESLTKLSNKTINEDFKYVARIFTIINTLIKNNERDLAAIVFSYIKDFKYNDTPVYDIFSEAVEACATPEQKKQLKDERGKDIEFGRAAIQQAMEALKDKLKTDIQAFSTADSQASEDEEIEDESLADINKIILDALNFIKKP